MPVTVKLPTPLRRHADGAKSAEVQADTVGAALEALVSAYPAIADALFAAPGELKPFVRVFVGERDIADAQGLATPLAADDVISIVPPVAGA
ncbi:MAG: molybdopterin synthase sulfur carrier subunit [Armatimonadetes bacterium]|nr:molybdopterin synthase sulfur carrier subunit [Armatimonadota bacterium]